MSLTLVGIIIEASGLGGYIFGKMIAQAWLFAARYCDAIPQEFITEYLGYFANQDCDPLQNLDWIMIPWYMGLICVAIPIQS